MKKTYLSVLLLSSLAMMLIGCSGGVLSKNISPSPTPNVHYVPEENTVVLSGIKNVAIFPFADYSHQQDYLGVDSWGGNIRILEEITDHLVAHGISVAVQEDVNTLLVDHDIIRPIDKKKYLIYGTFEEEDESYKEVASPEYELANYAHSADMAREILNVINLNKKQPRASSQTPVLQGSTVGLSKEKVVELSQILGVDLVIRGRIIDYGFKDVGTMNPLYRGVVPVAIDSVKDLLFGTSPSYGYEDDLEDIESILAGAAMGYVIGNNIIDSSTSHSSGITSGIISRRTSSSHRSHDDNAPEGAAVGAAAGWLAAQHPKKAKRSAVVQVRIYAQETATGNVLWSNRVEMEYTPKSNFAYKNTHPKVMFEKAIKEGVKVLMDSFFSDGQNTLSDKHGISLVQKQGT